MLSRVLPCEEQIKRQRSDKQGQKYKPPKQDLEMESVSWAGPEHSSVGSGETTTSRDFPVLLG